MDEDLLEVLEAMAANGNPGAIAVLRRLRVQLAQAAPNDPFYNEQAARVENETLLREQLQHEDQMLALDDERDIADTNAVFAARGVLARARPQPLAPTHGTAQPTVPGLEAPPPIAPVSGNEKDAKEAQKKRELEMLMRGRLASRR